VGTINGLMNIAQRAMEANQEALNVTANNVANQNTVGYTREVVSFQDGASVNLKGGLVSNLGVSAVVTSQRDRVLEQRVQQQTQASAQSSAYSSALNSLQQIVAITASSTNAASSTIGDALTGFYSSLTSLAADPTSTTSRQTVLTAAGTFASALNSASSQASAQSTQLQGDVSSDVTQVNALLKSVASLNSQIASTGSTQDAGVLEDQRQNALAQLSQLIGINQTTTENNEISLTTSGGALLIAGDVVSPLSVTSTNIGVQLVDATGATLTSVQGGSIGGNLEAIQNDIPNFLNSLNTLATGVADQVNTQNALGTTSAGPAGGDIFSYNPLNPAGTLAVVATDPSAIATAGKGEGVSGTTNANALAALSTQAISGTQNSSDYYASILTATGGAAQAASTDATVQSTALSQVTTQRDTLSSVSLDEEAANLTEYQKAYQAAAKIFSIVDDILTTSINIGIQTAVS
jgi:flagellar hook-associated protein 1 FlgK